MAAMNGPFLFLQALEAWSGTTCAGGGCIVSVSHALKDRVVVTMSCYQPSAVGDDTVQLNEDEDEIRSD